MSDFEQGSTVAVDIDQAEGWDSIVQEPVVGMPLVVVGGKVVEVGSLAAAQQAAEDKGHSHLVVVAAALVDKVAAVHMELEDVELLESRVVEGQLFKETYNTMIQQSVGHSYTWAVRDCFVLCLPMPSLSYFVTTNLAYVTKSTTRFGIFNEPLIP